MWEQLKFDTFLPSSSTIEPLLNEKLTPSISSEIITNATNYKTHGHVGVPPTSTGNRNVSSTPLFLTAVSTVSTLALIYILTKDNIRNSDKDSNKQRKTVSGRSTPLPGYGIMGDKVNEVIELFLDALAVYVHNDNKWECQRRMLCEANQRAGEYGVLQGVVMYFLSLAVSLLLENQKVSDSLEAMKIGRRGGDCAQLYQKCPFSL